MARICTFNRTAARLTLRTMSSNTARRYNPPNERRQNMKPTKLIWFLAALTGSLLRPAIAATNPWDAPAATLAARIADVLGPGQARLSIQNLSSVPTEQVPAIRNLLAEDLKARGIAVAGTESANSIRVTLSENSRERVWVAEVEEGNETHVSVVEAGPLTMEAAKNPSALVLRRETLVTSDEPVLSAVDVPAGLLLLDLDQVLLYSRLSGVWQQQQHASLTMTRPAGRDPRGALLASADGSSFDAWLADLHCNGNIAAGAM